MSEVFEQQIREAAGFRLEDPAVAARERAYAVFPASDRIWARVLRTSFAAAVRRSAADSFQVAVQVADSPVRIQYRRGNEGWTAEMRAPGCELVGGVSAEGGWTLTGIADDEAIAVAHDGTTYWIASPEELASDAEHDRDPR